MNSQKNNRDIKVNNQSILLKKKPSNIQLFRYSAITWNVHRIHFDKDYAKQEGYPDVLVQSSLHIAFFTQLCTDWMGVKGELLSIDVKVKKYALVNETLTCQGVIVDKKESNEHYLIEMEMTEFNSEREVCAIGKAVIKLPM